MSFNFLLDYDKLFFSLKLLFLNKYINEKQKIKFIF